MYIKGTYTLQQTIRSEMRESKQLCNTDSAMNVINEKGQRIRGKKKNVDLVWTTNFQCSVLMTCFEIWKHCMSQPICWNLKWHFLKKQLCPSQGQQALKHQIAACSLLFMEVWISVIHATGPRGSSQHLYQFTQIHTHTTQTRSTADSTRHFLYTLLQSTLSPIRFISHCNTWVTS